MRVISELFLQHWLDVLAIFSVIFAIWSHFKNLKMGEITFVADQPMQLVERAGTGIEGLDIKYCGKVIKENLILFNFALINSGNFDLKPETIEVPLNIKLPEGWKWQSVNVHVTDVRATAKITSDNTIEIISGLFKTGESISVRALLEAPASFKVNPILNNLGEKIKFEHRIPDIKPVKIFHINKSSMSVWNLIFETIVAVGVLGLLLFTLLNKSELSIGYPYRLEGGHVSYVVVKPLSGDQIQLQSPDKKIETVISLDQFSKYHEVDLQIIPSRPFEGEGMISFFVIFFLYFFWGIYCKLRSFWVSKKLYLKLKNSN